MEQQDRRFKFIYNFLIEVYDKINLKKDFLEKLISDPNNPCKDLMNSIKNIESYDALKMFVILEFTKETNSTQYLARILRNDNQNEVANALEKFNKLDQLIEYTRDMDLKVRSADNFRPGCTGRYEMETTPRGICIIINNAINLGQQLKQTENVFKQMFFDVEIISMKSAFEISEIFENFAKSDDYKQYNALIIVVFGQASDGLIYGHNYKRNPIDNIRISSLIDILSEDKCLNFKNKPKIFIFDICSAGNKINSETSENTKVIDNKWFSKNINSTVIYSCAEVDSTYYSRLHGFTYFGLALTHTLAQYACEQNLDQLVKTINRRLDKDGITHFAQIHQYIAAWTLYFNPGLLKKE